MVINEELSVKLSLAVVAALSGALTRTQWCRYPVDLKRADGTPDPKAGQFNRVRFFTELSSAICFGIIASGIGEYMHAPLFVIGGLSAALGLLGAAAVTSFVDGIVKSISNAVSRKIDHV